MHNMKDMFSLEGKIAVVVGGAGGIGESLAMGLGSMGATVVVSSRKQEALDKVAQEIVEETGSESVGITCDVTSEESLDGLAAAVKEKYGKIDILVNASGLNIKHPAYEYDMADWDKLFAVNVKGTMNACKAFAKVMKRDGGGAIVNLSSVRGIRGYTGGNTGYCATKGSVELITKALALEWAPDNIRVNALGPALVITSGTKHIKDNPELAKKYAAAIPMGRIAEAEDMVGAVAFLCSDAASFVTGQSIYVDGGLTA